MVNYLLEGEKLFALLIRYAATRNADLSEMLKRYVDVTDCFATLICALTCMLSDQATKGVQDRVVRDLMADAFDFLYEARSLTLKRTQMLMLTRSGLRTRCWIGCGKSTNAC